jgi:YD repeat-containing protein
MPHDFMPLEFSLDDSDERIPATDEIEKDSGILSKMKNAGRSLVRKAKRFGTKSTLAAMMTAGALMVSPAMARGQSCVANYPVSGVIDCGGSNIPPSGDNLGSSSAEPGDGSSGDPVNIATGNVFYNVTDYSTQGANPLQLTRYYNSMTQQAGVTTLVADLIYSSINAPSNWRTNYDRYLQFSPSTSPTQIIAERPDGQQIIFTNSGGPWTTNTDLDYTLTQSGSTWTLMDHNDTAEVYTNLGSGKGQLNTITLRNGYEQTMSYSGANLSSVSDSYGRKLNFGYSGALLTSVTTPDSLVLTYGYTIGIYNTLLTSVSYNTSPATSQTYTYGNSSFPLALTSITDENGHTSASWTYDSNGRAVTSQNGGSLAANLTTFSFSTPGITAVTNPFGVVDSYTINTYNNVVKIIGISRAATSTTAAASESFGYDGNGFMNSFTDWNGNQKTTVNNAQGNPTSITEAYGSPVARTTTISYDTTWIRLPHQIATTGLTSTFAYDGSGNPLSRTDLDTTTNSVPYSTGGQSRETQWTWTGNGLLASIQLPRTDVTAKTTLTYTGPELTEIQDALGHQTQITYFAPVNSSTYGGGLPETITDPNAVVTALTFDSRLNLSTSTVHATAGYLTTTLTHDPANRLSAVELPNGATTSFTYDTANRLTKSSDLLGNSVNYQLDALGDVTYAWAQNSSTATFHDTRVYDALGRTTKDTNGVSSVSTFTYDANSNLLTVSPPTPSGTVTYTYDALNRVATRTDPSATGSGVTALTYDAHDRVLSVQDPNGNTSSYVYNGFGDRTQRADPSCCTWVYHYDPDSNLTQVVMPGPRTMNATYDALDRPLTTTYPSDSTLNVSRTYDQTTGHGYGVGRLTSLTDQAGSLGLTWDQLGNITNESRVITSVGTLSTTTAYDAANNTASITYPSGTVVNYTRDSMGEVSGVTAKPPGASSASNVTTGITYQPALSAGGTGEQVAALTFGNGITGAYGYDLAARATTHVDTGTAGAVQSHTYGYYQNGSLFYISDAVNAANSQSFGYDALDRLTGAAATNTGGYGNYYWSWDKTGNVTSQTINSVTTNFTLTTGTNKLASYGPTSGPTTYVTNTSSGNMGRVESFQWFRADSGATCLSDHFHCKHFRAAGPATALTRSAIIPV